MAEKHRLNPSGVMEAVVDGVQAGEEDFGVKVSLIGIISRTYGVEAGWKELEALLNMDNALRALDLAGDEANFPGELFVEHFYRARERGLQITVHAGESAGPESIWQAINDLGAKRIGHAVRAIEDENLMTTMAEREIGIETSLTSNIQTSTIADYASHPLRMFLERGLLATINTDDPGISGIDLHYEYQVAAPAVGLTTDQIHQAQYNALQIAFLSTEEKQALLEKKRISIRK